MMDKIRNRHVFFLLCKKNFSVGVGGLYVSQHGQDAESCGNKSAPCQSLSHAISMSLSEETIFVQSTDNAFLHNLCSFEYLNKSLKLVGLGGKGEVSITCDAEPQDVWPFIIQTNANITLENLTFVNGDIILRDAVGEITNCVFSKTTVYIMDPETFEFYSNNTRSMQYMEEFHLTMMQTAYTPEEERKFCGWVKLSVKNSKWRYTKPAADQVLVDRPARSGFQIACFSVEVSIINSFLADKNVYIFAMRSLQFFMLDSTFLGLDEGQVKVGGLDVCTYAVPNVTIVQSRFEKLYFSDTVLAVTRSFMEMAIGAITIRDQSSFKLSKEPDIQIIDTTFRANLKAVGVWSSLPYLSVFVLNCTFLDNQETKEGAALSFQPSSDMKARIEGSLFKNNTAGVVPFGKPIKLVNSTIVQWYSLKVLDYKFVKDTIYVTVQQGVDGEKVLNTVITELRGTGGAVFIKKGELIIHNCQFEDNKVNRYGGAVYGSQNSHVKIYDSKFVGPASSTFSIAGYLIANYGRLDMANVELLPLSPPGRASVLVHSNDQLSDTYSLTNISLSCPPNTQLETYNSSKEDLSDPRVNRREKSLMFRRLSYDCHLCPTGRYSLSGGNFSVTYDPLKENDTTEILDASRYSHRTTYRYLIKRKQMKNGAMYEKENVSSVIRILYLNFSNVECFPCPYGGLCTGSSHIYAKPNYWGKVKNGRVGPRLLEFLLQCCFDKSD